MLRCGEEFRLSDDTTWLKKEPSIQRRFSFCAIIVHLSHADKQKKPSSDRAFHFSSLCWCMTRTVSVMFFPPSQPRLPLVGFRSTMQGVVVQYPCHPHQCVQCQGHYRIFERVRWSASALPVASPPVSSRVARGVRAFIRSRSSSAEGP
jgi:hypothetical protein